MNAAGTHEKLRNVSLLLIFRSIQLALIKSANGSAKRHQGDEAYQRYGEHGNFLDRLVCSRDHPSTRICALNVEVWVISVVPVAP